jgi:hypothetical protein
VYCRFAGSTGAFEQGKEIQVGTEVKTSLFADDMIFYKKS